MEQKQVKRSTMAQIAKEAGVSTTTVSKVLNQLPAVGASTRARIQQMIEQYDYVQNTAMPLQAPRVTLFSGPLPTTSASW